MRPAQACLAELATLRGLLASAAQVPAVRVHLAQALLATGQFQEAAEQATTCVAGDDTLIEAWLIRAEAGFAQGLYPAAAADFQHASSLAPLRPGIMLRIAACHLAQERLAAAEAVLRRAVAVAPFCAPALANLGAVLVRRGAMAEAEAPCRRALALDVGLVSAHQNLGGILAETDPVAARAHRDAAYRRQQIFVQTAYQPDRTVLVLAAAEAANVPLRFLFDPARTTLVTWYVEYARPGQDRSLPPFDLAFNAVGDPDLAPSLPASVRRVLRSRRVLNHPDRVARTARSKLPALLDGIAGVMVPPVLCHEGDSSLAAAAAQLGYPVLARPLGAHGGVGLSRLDDPSALARVADGPGYVTRYIDYADADGFFRKYRVIFVDRVPYAYHLAIGPGWMVHHCTAGMDHDPARRAEEQGFLENPAATLGAPALAALGEIGRRLDLDYAGIDFGLLPDGRILVFEANATMLVEPEEGLFAYRNPAVRVIQSAFARMLRRNTRRSARLQPLRPAPNHGEAPPEPPLAAR